MPSKAAAPQAKYLPTNCSGSDLTGFAAVQDDLEGIRRQYYGKLESTENPEQADQLQPEASQKIVPVVQDVETYSNIALALQNDADLRDKVKSTMN